jgi:hypothetical protein
MSTDPAWLAHYDTIKDALLEEMRPFVLTLREHIDNMGEPAAMVELFNNLRDRPHSEIGGLALHAILLLAKREAIE